MPRYHRVVTKILIGVVIALGLGVVGAAPAGADPSVFSALSCSCQETAPAGSQARRDEIARGIQQSLSLFSPGPEPTRLP
jgi:hypothetical protein